MKTAKYKIIDDHKIFDGFGFLAIDPELTRQKTRISTEQLPEKRAIDEKVRQRMSVNAKGREALKRGRIAERIIKTADQIAPSLKGEEKGAFLAKVEASKKEFPKQKAAYEQLLAQDKVIEAELSELNTAFEAKRKEMVRQSPAYCLPGKNQVAITDDQFQEIFIANAEKSEYELITIDAIEEVVVVRPGNELQDEITSPTMVYKGFGKVDDYRGSWWIWDDAESEWISNVVEILGVKQPPEAIKDANLTAEQRKEIRLQKLTVEQKEVEKLAAIAAAKREAALYKTELEIDGDKDALSKAQALLAEKTAEIEAKYA